MRTAYSALLTGCAQLSKVLAGFVLLKMIAYYLGAAGLGALGNFMSLTTIVSMLAGGGVTNGVIKYVAEYKGAKKKLSEFVNSAVVYSCIASLVIMILGMSFSGVISQVIFGSPELRWIIILSALFQFCFAFANLVTGVATGLGEVRAVAKIQIVGNVIGLPIAYLLLRLFGIVGAAIGILVVLGAQFLPAYVAFYLSRFKIAWIRLDAAKPHVRSLLLYTVMIATSVIAFPVIEIAIRDRLIRYAGYHSTGIWQGAVKLSSAYLNFFSIFLAYYFVPLVSAVKDKGEVAKYAWRALVVISLLFVGGAAVFYSFRDFFISLLLSSNFSDLRDFIVFQLIGDFFKAGAYVFGYIAVAKAAAKLYIVAEIVQSVGFFGLAILFGMYLQPLQSVFLAYMVNYMIYFFVAVLVFVRWRKD
ncbi:O-antigen translocase [Ralstonia wenshanensis]|uniref:Lipid III flippase n=1 Tax=Ralstonia wenshanensis TaxID=2842456 RepID=A0AAD2AQE8_9RALS|nr:O-antigen translocase [Ralstonia wenshanensis]CAJ0686509.1 Lipid III flippase [Ralstonia wenshanensis]